MAAPLTTSQEWGDIVTSTLESRSRKLANNISNNNALLGVLKTKGHTDTWDGGREIMQELSYAQNQSFQWYSGYENLNISLNDTMTAARFPIKQASIAVTISGLEELQNDGDEKMFDLIEARVKTAERTFENQMSAGIYSDGSAFGGKQINGLALLVSKVPTSGIVGGIDRGSQVWWRNFAVNANLDPRGIVTTSNIVSYMNSTTVNLKRNTDGIDLIVMDNNFYLAYVGTLQSIQRITSDKGMAGAGWTSLEYFGAGKKCEVVLDGGKNGQIPPNTAYFLNSDYFMYRPHAKRNFKVIGGERQSVSQDAIVKIYGWAGNMTISNPSLQGVLWQ